MLRFGGAPPKQRPGRAGNAEVLRGLKTRTFKKKLEACGRGWYDELLSVLWSIHTTATKLTGETPFFLVYGAEAVLPHEVRRRSARVLAFDEAQQDTMRGMDLVPGEERHREVALRAQGTNRRYDDITAATSTPGPSR